MKEVNRQSNRDTQHQVATRAPEHRHDQDDDDAQQRVRVRARGSAGEKVMPELGGDMVKVDRHRCHERRDQKAVADSPAQGPQDDQGGEQVSRLIERPARDERIASQTKGPIGEPETHHGRPERAWRAAARPPRARIPQSGAISGLKLWRRAADITKRRYPARHVSGDSVVMLLTIVSIWAIVIPLVILAASWQLANLRDARGSQSLGGSAAEVRGGDRAVPPCAVPSVRPRRTTTRRVCPDQPRRAGRRPASA